MDKQEIQYQIERQRMVEEQLRRRNIVDERVLNAMLTIPRHLFVPQEHRHLAYVDAPLPIGAGQTISQPYIVALMTQLLLLKGEENVLEVGTGSGYQAAILGLLAKEVHTIERHRELAMKAAALLQDLKIQNVHVHIGDGSLGLQEYAPFQAILVTAAAPEVPKPLLEQLDQGGRLVIPVGGQWGQNLERWVRSGSHFEHEVLVPVAFVPLRGEAGWKEERWNWD
ncbi:MAG: protein-L-isoaspartate(D-aspartate) O-methyltransferase [Anaerolineales bacterium]